MPTNDKNQSQDTDRSRQASNQNTNQASNRNDSTRQAGSTDRDTQSGLSGKSGQDDSMKKSSGSRSDSDDSNR